MKFLLRQSCEYSTVVEAENREMAEKIGEKIPPKKWDTRAWSQIESEEMGDEEN